MEQKYKNIKGTKEFFFAQIKEAEEGLKELKERCDHPEEFIEICDYMWAPGHIEPNVKMCQICGKVILTNYISNWDIPPIYNTNEEMISDEINNPIDD